MPSPNSIVFAPIPELWRVFHQVKDCTLIFLHQPCSDLHGLLFGEKPPDLNLGHTVTNLALEPQNNCLCRPTAVSTKREQFIDWIACSTRLTNSAA
jgi:hypothetical protein